MYLLVLSYLCSRESLHMEIIGMVCNARPCQVEVLQGFRQTPNPQLSQSRQHTPILTLWRGWKWQHATFARSRPRGVREPHPSFRKASQAGSCFSLSFHQGFIQLKKRHFDFIIKAGIKRGKLKQKLSLGDMHQTNGGLDDTKFQTHEWDKHGGTAHDVWGSVRKHFRWLRQSLKIHMPWSWDRQGFLANDMPSDGEKRWSDWCRVTGNTDTACVSDHSQRNVYLQMLRQGLEKESH